MVELGGALRHYAIGPRLLLDGFAADDRTTGGRGRHPCLTVGTQHTTRWGISTWEG